MKKRIEFGTEITINNSFLTAVKSHFNSSLVDILGSFTMNFFVENSGRPGLWVGPA